MKFKQMKSKIIGIAIFVLTLSSCKENDIVFNIDEIDYRSIELSAPIVSKLHIPLYESMEKWLDLGDMSIEKGVICIKYMQSDIIEWSRDIKLDDIDEGWSFDLNQTLLEGLRFTGTLSPEVNLTTSETGTYVTEADLAAGWMRFTFTVPNNVSSCDIAITIDEVFNSEGVFNQVYRDLKPGENVLPYISIAGYQIKAPNRKIKVNFAFTVTTTGNTQPSSGNIGIKLVVTNWDVKYLSGYFGQIEEKIHDIIELNFFNELDFDRKIGLFDMELKTEITNYTGLPLKIEATNFEFADESGKIDDLKTTDDIYLKIPAAIETDKLTHFISPAKLLFTTNMLKPIEFESPVFPTKINFNITGLANPDGIGETDNFVLFDKDHGLATIDLTLTIPLHFKVEAYSRTDTIKFDYNDLIKDNVKLSEGIQYIAAEMDVYNNMPFEVELAADVIDEWDNVIETILSGEIIKTDPKNIEVKFTEVQLENFRRRDAKNIVLYTKASTENEDYVQVHHDASLDIFVSVRLKSKIPSIF